MSLVNQILLEGYGETDKVEVLAAVNEIRSQGQINPFNSNEVLLDNKVLVEVGFFDGALWVSSITSIEKGGGSYGMKIIIDAADKHGVIIRLSSEPYGKKTLNKGQLTAWYKRLGFKKSDYGDMSRQPRKTMTENINEPISYLYHGTSFGALIRIAKEGIKPSVNREAQPTILTNNELYAKSYADRKGGKEGVILKVIPPKDIEVDNSVVNKKTNMDYKTFSIIPPENIQVKRGSDWVSIDDYLKAINYK